MGFSLHCGSRVRQPQLGHTPYPLASAQRPTAARSQPHPLAPAAGTHLRRRSRRTMAASYPMPRAHRPRARAPKQGRHSPRGWRRPRPRQAANRHPGERCGTARLPQRRRPDVLVAAAARNQWAPTFRAHPCPAPLPAHRAAVALPPPLPAAPAPAGGMERRSQRLLQGAPSVC